MATFFSCQKTAVLEEQPNTETINNQSAADRSCSLVVTPLYGAGSDWHAEIRSGNIVLARICGTGYENELYTKVNWNTTYTVPGGSTYKKYSIALHTRDVAFKMNSDAGCLVINMLTESSRNIYAGCNVEDCTMNIKVNYASDIYNWLAKIYEVSPGSCLETYKFSIGGPNSGANIIIPEHASQNVYVEGFRQVIFKQFVGSVNYTINAPSQFWAPITPNTFTLNPNTNTTRYLGCGG